MWELDLCSSLAFLLASGLATVATCVAMVFLAHKHKHIQIWPMPFSFAGSTYPCRWVSRVGFGSAAFFMAMWAPGVSQAFVGSLLKHCLRAEAILWLNFWFCCVAWTAALGLFVQGTVAPLKEGTHCFVFVDGIPDNWTHWMHIKAVGAMFMAVFVFYVSAIIMIFPVGFLACGSISQTWSEKFGTSLTIFMLPFVVGPITCGILLWFQGTAQAEREQRAKVAFFRAGGRLQWTCVVAVTGVFGALALQVLTFERVDTNLCKANDTFLWASFGLPFALFVAAFAYGFTHGVREKAGAGARGGPGHVKSAPPLSSVRWKLGQKRARSDGDVEEMRTFGVDALRAALLMPQAQQCGSPLAAQPLLG